MAAATVWCIRPDVRRAYFGAQLRYDSPPRLFPEPRPNQRIAVKDPARNLVAIPGGKELLWSLDRSGKVRRATLTKSGRVGPTVTIARLQTARGGRLGITGLAATRRGRVYVSYVRRSDHRLVVSEIGARLERKVWLGPKVKHHGIGGAIRSSADGKSLFIALGFRSRSIAMPPNGRLLKLKSEWPSNQTPIRVSRGWVQPTAFATAGGRIFVADWSGAGLSERVGFSGLRPEGSIDVEFARWPVAAEAVSEDMVKARRLELNKIASSLNGRSFKGWVLTCGKLSGWIDATPIKGNVLASPQIVDQSCRYGMAVQGRRVYVINDHGKVIRGRTVSDLLKFK